MTDECRKTHIETASINPSESTGRFVIRKVVIHSDFDPSGFVIRAERAYDPRYRTVIAPQHVVKFPVKMGGK